MSYDKQYYIKGLKTYSKEQEQISWHLKNLGFIPTNEDLGYQNGLCPISMKFSDGTKVIIDCWGRVDGKEFEDWKLDFALNESYAALEKTMAKCS